jgi:hypothetical protein
MDSMSETAPSADTPLAKESDPKDPSDLQNSALPGDAIAEVKSKLKNVSMLFSEKTALKNGDLGELVRLFKKRQRFMLILGTPLCLLFLTSAGRSVYTSASSRPWSTSFECVAALVFTLIWLLSYTNLLKTIKHLDALLAESPRSSAP